MTRRRNSSCNYDDCSLNDKVSVVDLLVSLKVRGLSLRQFNLICRLGPHFMVVVPNVAAPVFT